MRTKQNICMIAALVLFLFAAGMIETNPLGSLALVALMAAPVTIGKLGKKRVTVEDIERRCRYGKN